MAATRLCGRRRSRVDLFTAIRCHGEMRRSEVEAWVLRIVDDVLAGRQDEDATVELKRDWPDPRKAARRLAGHANAARGEPILWIIGIDGSAREAPGAPKQDLADWWPQVRKCFDGEAPDLLFDVSPRVPDSDATVVGLAFQTDAAPFVISVPAQGSVDREVPWRQGTRVRSAKREELLRVLVPLQRKPEVTVLHADLSESTKSGGSNSYWSARVVVYLVPRTPEPIWILKHKVQAFFRHCGDPEARIHRPKLVHLGRDMMAMRKDRGSLDSLTLRHGDGEIQIVGPTALWVEFGTETQSNLSGADLDFELGMRLLPALFDAPVQFSLRLEPTEAQEADTLRWTYRGNSGSS